MHKALSGLPTFDPEAFVWRIRDWRPLMDGPGNDRVVVEWCVTSGPKVFVYPAARRSAGFDLAAGASHSHSDERWADFLEFDFVPKVVEALAGAGFRPQVVCADQRPVQTMRQRRREIEARSREKTGAAAH